MNGCWDLGLADRQLVRTAETEGPHAAGKDGQAKIADAVTQVVSALDNAQGKNPILKTAFVRFLICCIIYCNDRSGKGASCEKCKDTAL